MKLIQKFVKYFLLLPLMIVQFSCSDDDPVSSTIHNGDLVGSWMLTDLAGTYHYTVGFPADGTSGLNYTDTDSFGIQIKWNYADAILGAAASDAQFWVPGAGPFGSGETSLYKVATYNLTEMTSEGFGLIGVFEDAPSSGADATYKIKGQYPGIFYNYSQCASAGDTAPMTDQGLYTYDQTSSTANFTIKRDPEQGDQVLPTFGDGTLLMVEDTLSIHFLDRDSHSTLYSSADSEDSWDEGTHPDATNGGNGENSGGDRTYMAFPPLVVDADNAFAGPWDGAAASAGSTVCATCEAIGGATTGYYKSADFTYWGGYATFKAFVVSSELEYLKAMGIITTDLTGDGTLMDETITYINDNLANVTYSTEIPYSLLGDGSGVIDDSGYDFDPTSPTTIAAGGKLSFEVIRDCAVPVDVTIDFNATFQRCTTDNCEDDGYHVAPIWD